MCFEAEDKKKLEELRKKFSIIRPVIADFSTDGVEVIKQKIQKLLICSLPLHLHSLLQYQHPPPLEG